MPLYCAGGSGDKIYSGHQQISAPNCQLPECSLSGLIGRMTYPCSHPCGHWALGAAPPPSSVPGNCASPIFKRAQCNGPLVWGAVCLRTARRNNTRPLKAPWARTSSRISSRTASAPHCLRGGYGGLRQTPDPARAPLWPPRCALRGPRRWRPAASGVAKKLFPPHIFRNPNPACSAASILSILDSPWYFACPPPLGGGASRPRISVGRVPTGLS